MTRLLKYLKPYIGFVILAPLLMMLEVWADLSLPTLMSDIVNTGVANRDMDYVLKIGLQMVGFSLLGILGGVGSSVFANLSSMNACKNLRRDLFAKTQAFSFANIERFSTSSLTTRLTNDVTQVQQVMAMMMRGLVRMPLLFLGGMYMAYSLSHNLSRVFLVAVPLIIIAFIIILAKGMPLFRKVQTKLDKLNQVMRENLAGVRVVKAFVREDYEREKFDDANEDFKKNNVRAFRIIAFLNPGAMTVMNLSVVFVLWMGGKYYEAGTLPLGNIMAYINYMTQILMSLMMLAMQIMNVSRGNVSAERINEVLEAEIDIVDPEKPQDKPLTAGTVEFRNVSFRYPDSTGDLVLSDISFKAERGETIGIIGETGSGKTTLVSLIPRLYDATEGMVLVDGVDVREQTLDGLRGKIGVVLQQAILFTGNIRDNIKWGNKDATDEEVEEVAKIAQAHDFIIEQRDGYDTDLSQMAVNLSGGQKQRLSIARALLKRPQVMIFDDSTSALDTVTEASLLKSLRKVKGCTKFIIAQRISSVIEADKIIVLQGGEIKAVGKHEELMKNSEIYRDIYYSQREKEVFAS